jgi:NAD dependent epimerase/dehydratase family enzyme
MSSILITGGTGLVGTRLAKLLSQNEHQVSLLSRSSGNSEHKTFIWNPEKKIFPIEALKNVDFIVHLAGAGIADKYWTKKYKEKIVRSRVDSANLIF